MESSDIMFTTRAAMAAGHRDGPHKVMFQMIYAGQLLMMSEVELAASIATVNWMGIKEQCASAHPNTPL